MIFSSPVLADEAITCVQQVLNDLGYAAGPVDGAIGGRTRSASALLASDAGLVLPDLSAETGSQWCEALTAFAGTPQADALLGPARSVIPGDILLQMPDIAAGPGANFCGASNPASQGALQLEPFSAISGFSSRMSNIAEVENARELERFAGEFGGQAVAAYAGGNTEAQAELVRLFAKWAEADALLGTESCVRGDGSLITSGVCTEWTVDDGSDPSGMKDATFVTFIGAGLVRAYYATLSTVMTDELATEHAAIKSWIGKWAERLKTPRDVYFGLNMGWYWPTIAEEIADGDLDSARNHLQRIADTMIQLIKDDGSITDRTTRGNRALWYHFTSLGEVVMSMELMRAAGMTPPAALEEDLHKAVRLFIEAVNDHDFIDKWARVANNSIYDGTQDWDAGWMHGDFAGTWLHIYPYRYAGLPEADELRTMVGQRAGSATSDIDLGLPLGCLYESASALRGLGSADLAPPEPALPFEVRASAISAAYEEPAFTEFSARLTGMKLGDTSIPSVNFDVYADFNNDSGKTAGNLAMLRLVIPRSRLREIKSRQVDYSECGDLAVQLDGAEQNLRLHYGRERTLNACVLDKMTEGDRALYSAIHANFATAIAGADGEDAVILREYLAAVE